MPKLDLDSIPQNNATGYPAPFDAEVQGRWKRRLGSVSGLTDFGASHVVLKPGAWSCAIGFPIPRSPIKAMPVGFLGKKCVRPTTLPLRGVYRMSRF